MKIEVRTKPFDPWVEVAAYEKQVLAAGAYGATAVFVGATRDLSGDDSVQAMHLEHYPGMTEKHLTRIAEEAMQRWPINDALILHRVGDLKPGDPIVLVAAWSAHRADAFAACRFLIEDLKSRAPLWKKEQLEAGSRWVKCNTPG
ncbi:MAG TPA: molybdenum cofactor biosynthesis protein MoaE [Gammaproteobacteria bacterium]|nr:molybdenum cofactor biosynthesis protein MoaE [Gammaproteobacteria bacterium]